MLVKVFLGTTGYIKRPQRVIQLNYLTKTQTLLAGKKEIGNKKTFISPIPGHRLLQARAWCKTWSLRQWGWSCRGSCRPSQRSSGRPWCWEPRQPERTSRRVSHCRESPVRRGRSGERFIKRAIIQASICYLEKWQVENWKTYNNGIKDHLPHLSPSDQPTCREVLPF